MSGMHMCMYLYIHVVYKGLNIDVVQVRDCSQEITNTTEVKRWHQLEKLVWLEMLYCAFYFLLFIINCHMYKAQFTFYYCISNNNYVMYVMHQNYTCFNTVLMFLNNIVIEITCINNNYQQY